MIEDTHIIIFQQPLPHPLKEVQLFLGKHILETLMVDKDIHEPHTSNASIVLRQTPRPLTQAIEWDSFSHVP